MRWPGFESSYKLQFAACKLKWKQRPAVNREVLGSIPRWAATFYKENSLKIADMLTPQVTPPQAREAIDRIIPALTERLGSDISFVSDLLSLLRALAPADFIETMKKIDDYAANSAAKEKAILAAQVDEPPQQLTLDDASKE